MRMPGFTAETSLGKSTQHYSGGAVFGSISARVMPAQNTRCTIAYDFCVDLALARARMCSDECRLFPFPGCSRRFCVSIFNIDVSTCRINHQICVDSPNSPILPEQPDPVA
jgi:hypothetical protein